MRKKLAVQVPQEGIGYAVWTKMRKNFSKHLHAYLFEKKNGGWLLSMLVSVYNKIMTTNLPAGGSVVLGVKEKWEGMFLDL